MGLCALSLWTLGLWPRSVVLGSRACGRGPRLCPRTGRVCGRPELRCRNCGGRRRGSWLVPAGPARSVRPRISDLIGLRYPREPFEHKPGRAVPPGLADRPVVAKTTPPPPPVSFERQESALKAHPGRPLERNEVETLRPAEVAHPLVKQTSPNPAQTPNPNRGAG